MRSILPLALACACHDAMAQAGEAIEMVRAASAHIEEILQDLDFASAADRERRFEEIRRIVAPRFDHERFSRGVMAKYYRQASLHQKERLAAIIAERMPRSIAATVIGCSVRRIEVVPPDQERFVRPGEASVGLLLHAMSGTTYPVQLSLALAEDGAWRAKNVVFNGINIGLAFRKNFAQEMQRAGGSLDQAVQSLAMSPVGAPDSRGDCTFSLSGLDDIGEGVVWVASALLLIPLLFVASALLYGIYSAISA